MRSLNPKYFFQAFPDLDETVTNHLSPRSDRAERIVEKVEQTNAYLAFIKILEQDEEHLGHKYIVSLLKGKEYAPKEELEDSDVLLKAINSNVGVLVQQLDVSSLLPSLLENNLITGEDEECLANPNITTRDEVRKLFMLLKTKGPTAHHIFVRKCLRTETEHIPHSQLYDTLTSFKITRRNPHSLESPKRIRRSPYLVLIEEVRRLHQIGGDEWSRASEICSLISAPGSQFPPEMKIAFSLENCNIFILSGQSNKVFPIVEQARKMCHKLEYCNPQALEVRCEWILAKLYRCRKQPALLIARWKHEIAFLWLLGLLAGLSRKIQPRQ